MPRRRMRKTSTWNKVRKLGKNVASFGKSGRARKMKKMFIPQVSPRSRW
jgi:hypothetical protein